MKKISKFGASKRFLMSTLTALAGMGAANFCVAAPLVDISPTPLYGSQSPHPNVTVSLSVEFPTVGVAFANTSYNGADEYIGYFEPGKCYTYTVGTPGYFAATSPVLNTSHECSDKFSGNFMNWLTMSAIDEFRYAMTGGNRVVDYAGASGAIIQRAYIPDGSVPGVPSFYDSGNFPGQTLPSTFMATVVPLAVAGSGNVSMHNCRTQVYFGDGGGDCFTPDQSRGAFDVRVAVCRDVDLPVRTDLCQNYGSTTVPIYKPVGQAQINAAKVRFAAFGYLMDRNPPSGGCNDGLNWNRCRYGGVLRAPMRYLGPLKYDANLLPSSNPQKEINADGTLVDDPDSSAVAPGIYSGFINYINKFGATGVYKRYDPMGEMYYEAIRYYQNLPATLAAYDPAPSSSLSADTLDNFPITTNWTDPILARCSKNFIVNLSDANTWDDTNVSGYSGSPSPGLGRPGSRTIEGGLDAYAWTQKIGDLEADPATTTLAGSDPSLAGIQDRQTGAAAATYFAAGVAYWANTNDIRSTLDGKQTVQTFSVDVNEASIPIVDRQLFLMGKYGGFTNSKDRAVDGTLQNPFWAVNPSDPSGPAIRSNSEWESPPGSGLPSGYLLASSPSRLINGLRGAFASFLDPVGTAAGAGLTSTNLIVAGAGAFIAKFTSNRWSGTVERHSVSIDSSFEAVVSPGPSPSTWDAGALLDARCGTVVAALPTCLDTSATTDRRVIYTAVPAATPGGRAAAEFTWAGISVDASYALALNTPDPTAPLIQDGRGPARLNFIRGYRADEGAATLPSAFRIRDSALGDIINSAPVYVGAPSTAVADDDYQLFYAAHVNRKTAVYVGANDGMLHAFDGSANAVGGTELFAYVPGFSKTDLSTLSDPGYLHKTFVDTTPKVQEVKLGTAWKTVLVGANGNGAQGIYALDVTNPELFDGSKVLFEFSDADDADFGSVMSAPEIAKLQVGGTAASPVFKYFAVVTGYNNSRTTANGRSDASVSLNGTKGFLFLIGLDHPIGSSWGAANTGGQYYKYAFDAPDPLKAMGLGPVTLLPSKTGDRTTSAMYFGDLQGDMWRFNTTMNGAPFTPANWWKSALVTGTTPVPIFRATDGTNPQPITERPEIGNGPFGSNLLFFGTGKYLGDSDLLPNAMPPYFAQQSQYAVLDTNPSTNTTLTRADLAARTAVVNGGGTSVTISGAAFNYSGASAKRGWYLDFPSSAANGERSVNKPAVRTGLLTFDTLTLAGDVCGSGGGFIYQVDALTGNQIAGLEGGYASTVGIPGPPQIVDLQSILNTNRATGEQINQRKQTTMVAGVKGTIDTTRDAGGHAVAVTGKVPPIGRVSWREISNWNDKTNH